MEENMQLLTNHIGYHINSEKRAVLMAQQSQHELASAFLVDAHNDEIVLELSPIGGANVDNWHQGVFFTLDFSQWTEQGHYYLRYQTVRSQSFEIAENQLYNRCFSDIIHYFKSQRCGGEFDAADKQASIVAAKIRWMSMAVGMTRQGMSAST
ncbi:glucosamine-link cellobiase [Vibrio variabilis]|uniref:Glucosamine-link cellobiase n=1 Tax=Vibrio variabilis TaxID=990271 RepID=A0ABQ0JDL0_9VIBR|nr:glucosamine-link cellobiase [Vibrio variabilis]